MIVAVGSARGPKVAAARRALAILRERFPDFLRGELRLIARPTPCGAPPTPRSSAEPMEGARQRALLHALAPFYNPSAYAPAPDGPGSGEEAFVKPFRY